MAPGFLAWDTLPLVAVVSTFIYQCQAKVGLDLQRMANVSLCHACQGTMVAQRHQTRVFKSTWLAEASHDAKDVTPGHPNEVKCLVTRYFCPIPTNWNRLSVIFLWLRLAHSFKIKSQHSATPFGFINLKGRFPAATRDLLSPASCSVLINAWMQALPEDKKKIWWRYQGI